MPPGSYPGGHRLTRKRPWQSVGDHIALGLGLAACQRGQAVGFTTAAALVHELLEARDERRLLRLQKQLTAYKLLIVDELGYVPLSPSGAELLFEVFSRRRAPRPPHAPRPHPRDERRELPPEGQPQTAGQGRNPNQR